MVFRVYKDKHGEWRWSLRAKNGKTIGDSSEGYSRKSKVTKMIGKIILGPHKIVE